MKGLFALSCTLELSIIIFKYKGEHITLKILTHSLSRFLRLCRTILLINISISSTARSLITDYCYFNKNNKELNQ